MAPLQAAANGRPADWLVAGLRGFAESVLSLVPAGFSAYVRFFHPAERRIGSREIAFVSWHEIAAANGKQAHAGMQFDALTGTLSWDGVGQPGVFDHPPESGSLPEELAVALAPVLNHNTATPDRCWFAIWEGFGGLPDEALRAPPFSAPHREYHLLRGPVDALAEGAYDFLGSNRRTYAGQRTAPGASRPRSISTRPISAATRPAARRSSLCRRLKRSPSIRRQESTSRATFSTPSHTKAARPPRVKFAHAGPGRRAALRLS